MITADTNIFVYLHDGGEVTKREIAREIVAELQSRDTLVGLQVVGEFQNVLRRRLKVASWIAARESRTLLEAFDTFHATRSAAEMALEQVATGRTSYWDALLLASAKEAGCEVFLSEDMTDGEVRMGVRVINPFGADGALAPAAREALGL